MRTLLLTCVLAALGLLVAGCGEPDPYANHPALDPTSAKIDMADVHPVTDEMQAAADALVGEQAFAFELANQDGEVRTLAQLTKSGPLVIFFIEKECPCCVEGRPHWDRVHAEYRDQVQFVGIINADVEGARKWAEANDAGFEILADPSLETIDALHARAALYTLVIGGDQRIVLQQPGYSQTALEELGNAIAGAAGIEPRPLDTRGAPERMTSGCAF
ncbi:MAG: peroxiredoxin family protein [Fimbriimonadaceae bacterium]